MTFERLSFGPAPSLAALEPMLKGSGLIVIRWFAYTCAVTSETVRMIFTNPFMSSLYISLMEKMSSSARWSSCLHATIKWYMGFFWVFE